MVLSFKTGQWTSRNTTGTDIITGVGFQPKAILIVSSAYFVAFDSIDGYAYFGIGAAVDTTAANQRAAFTVSDDAAATSISHQTWNNAAVCIPGTGDGNDSTGVISAIGTDGFTVNWTLASHANKQQYICFGGADLTNAKVGEITVPSVTGNQVITGVGFQPDVLILFGTGNTSSATATGYNRGLGFATSSSNQACNASLSQNGQANMVCKRYQRADNTACYALIDNTTPTNVGLSGSLVTMGSDGFTINWTTVATAQQGAKLGYLAMKGGNWKVGSIHSPTTGTAPVAQSTSGVGFLPRGLLMASYATTTATTVQANNHESFGMGSSATDRRCGFTGDNDAAATSVTMNVQKSAKIITMYTIVASEASSTINAEADLTSLNTDGFTLSWTTRDTNAYEIFYLAAGDTVAVTGARNLQISKGWFYSDN